MQDPILDQAPDAAFDADVTMTIPVCKDELTSVRSPALHERRSSQRITPVLRSSCPPRTGLGATLTVLTGMHTGRNVAIDTAPVTVGRAPDADLILEDSGVSRHHLLIARAAEGAFFAEDLRSTNGTFLRADRIGVALLHEGDLLQLGPNVRLCFASLDSALESSLQPVPDDTSVYDPMTRVFHRNYLDGRLLAELARAERANGEVTVLMIGVDSLEEVNEHFGHLAGDRVLCTIVARIRHLLHIEDVLARYDGDTFVVVAAGTAGACVWELAERVRRAVEGLHMSARGREVRITASIGVASLAELGSGDASAAALLATADARMCGAKSSGGNRVSNVDPALGQFAKRRSERPTSGLRALGRQ
jgi:diguanylate cyclase (GGDEF)-like protein